MATSPQETPFIKQLAANDRPTRDAALLSLRTYLTANRSLPPLTYLKIHKALFQTVWLCDRPRPQAALCTSLASLAFALPQTSLIPYLSAFWETMAREWTMIDVLRMEKFLLLVRRVVGAGWEFLRDKGWREEAVVGVLGVLCDGPLDVWDGKKPNGLRYHVVDVYVDELERVGALEAEGEGVPLERLLEPLRRLAKESPTRDVRRKCKEALLDERLPGNKKEAVEKEDEDSDWEGIAD